MIVRLAHEQDLPSFRGLAGEVEEWFGSMVGDPDFHRAVAKHIRLSTALVAVSLRSDVLGGLLFGGTAPTFHVHWIVVSERERGKGAGRALMEDATRRWVRGPGTIEVVTFGADHPGVVASGARTVYEHLGFIPAEAADPGPEGGSSRSIAGTSRDSSDVDLAPTTLDKVGCGAGTPSPRDLPERHARAPSAIRPHSSSPPPTAPTWPPTRSWMRSPRRRTGSSPAE